MHDLGKIILTAVITFVITCAVISPSPSDDEAQPTFNFTACHYCDNTAPKEYMFSYNDELVCPSCVYGAYRDGISSDTGKCHECGDFFYVSDAFGLGLCYRCGKSRITDCTFCGRVMYAWDYNGIFHVCPSCLGEACSQTDIVDILIDFNEKRN